MTEKTAQQAATVPSDHIMGVYNRAPLAFERGEGARLFTTDGQAYLDCMAGIAVNALGHSHPALVQAVKDQAEKLWHVSNVFKIPGQEKLAKVLTDATGLDEVFFTNSGAEAIECAIKTARKYHWAKGQPERIDIIGFDGSFHGRTLAAVNASGNAAYLEGFGPRMPGFVQLPFGDMDALKAAVGPTTAAIIVEPVQGEGGARALTEHQLQAMRQLCDKTGTLLILDEIQCGLGRTGKLFAWEWAAGVKPDIVALAKALGGGFPVGAMLAGPRVAQAMQFGAHGTTFGGNPLAAAVARVALRRIASPQVAANVTRQSHALREGLLAIGSEFDLFAQVRGRGLMLGAVLKPAFAGRAGEILDHAAAHGLLLLQAGPDVLRLVPALNIADADVAEGLARLRAAVAHMLAPPL